MKVLTTFEHLCTICNKAKLSSQISTAEPVHDGTIHSTAASTSLPTNNQCDAASTAIIPYAFSLISLLSKCPQIEMCFSTLHESKYW